VLVVTQFVAGLNLGEKYWQPTNRASTRADWGRNRRIVVVWKFHSALLTCTGKSANGSPSHRRLAKPLSMMMEPPGLALHLWRPGTGLITHVSYIGTFDGPQPFRTLS